MLAAVAGGGGGGTHPFTLQRGPKMLNSHLPPIPKNHLLSPCPLRSYARCAFEGRRKARGEKSSDVKKGSPRFSIRKSERNLLYMCTQEEEDDEDNDNAPPRV